MTQKEQVKKILREYGKIDNFFCINTRLTIRLGAIIKVLRDEGWEIKGDYIEGTKNWEYNLVKAPDEKSSLKGKPQEKTLGSVHPLRQAQGRLPMRNLWQASDEV